MRVVSRIGPLVVALALVAGCGGGDDGGGTALPVSEPDPTAVDLGLPDPGAITGIAVTLDAPAELTGTYDTAGTGTASSVLCAPLGKGGFFVSFVPVGMPTEDFPPGLKVASLELLTLGKFAGPGTAQARLSAVTASGERSTVSVEVEFVDALSGRFEAAEGEPALAGSWWCRTG